LGFSANGNLQTNLFPGAVYEAYQMKIYAQIYGSNEVYTIYDFSNLVTVIPDKLSNLNEIELRLISQDPTFKSNIVLSENSWRNLESIQEIQKISGLLNQQSLSDQIGLIQVKNETYLKFPPIYGPLANYAGVLAVKKNFSNF
jgi:hypothetical protein